jgi:hypothetical protein
MDEDEGRADDATMDAATERVARVIAELEYEYNMITRDIITVLINAAVTLAFDIWKEGEGDADDAKKIIQDTVAASLEAALKAGRYGPDGEPTH